MVLSPWSIRNPFWLKVKTSKRKSLHFRKEPKKEKKSALANVTILTLRYPRRWCWALTDSRRRHRDKNELICSPLSLVRSAFILLLITCIVPKSISEATFLHQPSGGETGWRQAGKKKLLSLITISESELSSEHGQNWPDNEALPPPPLPIIAVTRSLEHQEQHETKGSKKELLLRTRLTQKRITGTATDRRKQALLKASPLGSWQLDWRVIERERSQSTE